MLNKWWPPGCLLPKLYCNRLLTVLLLLSYPSFVCLLSLDQIEVGFISIREISRDKLGFVGILQSAACVFYHRMSGFHVNPRTNAFSNNMQTICDLLYSIVSTLACSFTIGNSDLSTCRLHATYTMIGLSPGHN